MSFTVDKLDHVEVFVRDIEQSILWYQKVLGLREIRRWDPYPVMIGAGGTMLALFLADDSASAPTDSRIKTPLRWRRVAWRTNPEGFEAAQKHLRECGVSFDGPIDHDGCYSIYFTDPDGLHLEITCYPE